MKHNTLDEASYINLRSKKQALLLACHGKEIVLETLQTEPVRRWWESYRAHLSLKAVGNTLMRDVLEHIHRREALTGIVGIAHHAYINI